LSLEPSFFPLVFERETSMTWSGRNFLCCSYFQGEFKFCSFPTDISHTSRFHDQDTGVVQLDAVTEVSAMLGHGCYLQLC